LKVEKLLKILKPLLNYIGCLLMDNAIICFNLNSKLVEDSWVEMAVQDFPFSTVSPQ